MQMVEWWAYLADDAHVLQRAYRQPGILAHCRSARKRQSLDPVAWLSATAGHRRHRRPGGAGNWSQSVHAAARISNPEQARPGRAAATVRAGCRDDHCAARRPAGNRRCSRRRWCDSRAERVVHASRLSSDCRNRRSASSAVKVGDRVLLLPLPTSTTATGFAVATVVQIAKSKDPQGQPITQFHVSDSKDDLTQVTDVTQFHLLRNADLSSQVWPYPAATGTVIQPGTPQTLQGGSSPTLQVDLVCDQYAVSKSAMPSSSRAPVTHSRYFSAIWQSGELDRSTLVRQSSRQQNPTVPPSTPSYSGGSAISPLLPIRIRPSRLPGVLRRLPTPQPTGRTT